MASPAGVQRSTVAPALIEEPPRGPKPNHRHFTVHNHSNGRFIYEPQLTDAYADFEQGIEDRRNVAVTSDGLRLRQPGSGEAVFNVRSPYIIVPQVGDLDRREDDTQAAILEWSGRQVSWSISTDNGLTWLLISPPEQQASDGSLATIDLTRWVSGRYGYSLRCELNGDVNDACLHRLKITTWVQLAPATLPALHKGHNAMRLVTGDHYGLPTRVMEVRSNAGSPEELQKYLVAPPEDYDPAHDRTDSGHRYRHSDSTTKNADRVVYRDRSVCHSSTGVCRADSQPHGVCGWRC